MGHPELYANRYYQDGADEIIYLDQVASLYGRNNLSEIVSRAAEEIYIPLTVGGGIRSVEDIQHLLRAGADKVAINTGAIANPQLITDGARTFGSQCIVLYVEAIRRGPMKYECLTDNARQQTGLDVFDWVRKAVELGAGEILLTSVDQEGTGKGYDLELTATVSQMVDVPVIASGGAGNPGHIKQVIQEGHADAVCAASLFHYAYVEEMSELNSRYEEGNIEFLKRGLPIPTLGRQGITATSIPELKSYLERADISTRQPRAVMESPAAHCGTGEPNA
jgi:cyclase